MYSYSQIALTIARAITDYTCTSKNTDYCPNCTRKFVINYINMHMVVLLLHAVTCDLLTQSLHRSVTMATGSQEYPLMEGQIITYTCQSGFVMNGPNASVCTGNGEWEPDPGEAYCTGDLHIK